ncbi:MAG: pantetheine-phosphate adenylyltransferase [Bacteriovoracaceae bacterium]|nr:pantetheine-phosphate adenylyltransferase [Bacteriovoracaceae bacterium]
MAEKKRAIYAGSFDPFTNGHYDILKRALRIFDEVVILLAISPTKKPLFSGKQRKDMLDELFKDNPNIKVETCNELVVDYARRNNISCLIRGLRPTGDFDSESQIASMNYHLFPDIETVFLMTGGKFYFISSTMVKEAFKWGGDISKFVPVVVEKYLTQHKGEICS